MRIKPFQAIFPNFAYIASPDSFCADAKNSFNEFQSAGFFEKSPENALYIYQIQTQTRRHTGVVGLNAVEDYFGGKIKKHENTLSDKEQQQMQLFLRWHAILKPVLLTFPSQPTLTTWLEQYADTHQPLFETQFEKGAEIHRVWSIAEPEDILYLQDFFREKVCETYIADGHHRTTTVALLHERLHDKHPELDFHDLFCAFFAADQLDILDFNRVIEGLRDITPTHFIVHLSQFADFEILPGPRKPTGKHELVMYMQREWYAFRWKQSVLDEHNDDKAVVLDATLLNELVLEQILNVEDVRTDQRIIYIPGSKGLDAVRKHTDLADDRIGFVLYPVAFDDLQRCADAGGVLPPKSTYFEPRLKSGLLVKMLNRG